LPGEQILNKILNNTGYSAIAMTDAWGTTMGTITNKLNQANFRYAVFAYWLFNGDHDYDRRHNEPVLAMSV
jgi:hypothetical protein